MPGLLDGQIANAIYAGFKGKLKAGLLWRAVVATSGGLDGRGDPLAVEPTTWPCEGFTDEYSDFFRTQAGIPETDLKVCIFAKSLAAGVRPQKDDKAKLGSEWFQLRKAATDPATALWICQAFSCPEPS